MIKYNVPNKEGAKRLMKLLDHVKDHYYGRAEASFIMSRVNLQWRLIIRESELTEQSENMRMWYEGLENLDRLHELLTNKNKD